MTRWRGALLLALAGMAHAASAVAPAKPLQQRFGDWTVACDNVRTCAAQGYQVADESGPQAGLWLSRQAGPQGTWTAQLHLGGADSPELPEGTLAEVRIGKRRFNRLPIDTDLPASTLLALVNAMLEAPQMQVTAAGSTATVSLQGLKASLLKMDDVQGRVGTVTAWVARGQAAASQVPAAPAVPVIVAAPPPVQLSAEEARPLLARLRVLPSVKGDCDLLEEAVDDADRSPDAQLFRVAPGSYLLLMDCGRAAYQISSRLWRVTTRPALAARPEVLPDVGEPAQDLMNVDFSEGRLSTWHKGRGVGDCGSSRQWVWTAAGFALRTADESPDCNGMPGGGPGLGLWQAEVRATAAPAKR